MKLKDKALRFRKRLDAQIDATRRLLRQDELADEDLLELIEMYDDWTHGVQVSIGEYYKYENELYQVITSHTTQEDWTPDATPAMFNKVQPEGVIPEWVEPAGSHNAYRIGDKVTYEGSIWISKIDGNTTVPDGDMPYNRYWEPVE